MRIERPLGDKYLSVREPDGESVTVDDLHKSNSKRSKKAASRNVEPIELIVVVVQIHRRFGWVSLVLASFADRRPLPCGLARRYKYSRSGGWMNLSR